MPDIPSPVSPEPEVRPSGLPPEAALRGAVIAARQQLAQSLHDTVCQTLTAAYFSAKFMEQKWRAQSPEVAAEIGELCEMIHGAVGELREITHGLRSGEAAAGDGEKT